MNVLIIPLSREGSVDIRIQRIAKHLESLTNEKTAQRILKACDTDVGLPSTPKKRERYIGCLINRLDEELTEKKRKEVMERCGRECIRKTTIERAINLRKKSKDINEFIDELNQNHIGGGKLRMSKGVIHGYYERCYCGAVSKSKHPISLTYCNCSAGWYRELFEKTMQKPVKVEVED